MFMKKGAMFGLDARIALAIFGALSVISGAALYSAIESSKAEKYRQYFVENVKASEQYMLDNGQFIPQKNDNTIYIGDLLTNRENLTTWKGPYISADVNNLDSNKDNITRLIHNDAIQHTALLQKSTWAANNVWPKCSAVGNADCAEYFGISFYNASSSHAGFKNLKAMFDLLDKVVDNSDGDKAGKVRMVYASSTNHYIYYQGLLRKRTI